MASWQGPPINILWPVLTKTIDYTFVVFASYVVLALISMKNVQMDGGSNVKLVCGEDVIHNSSRSHE